MKFLGRSLPPSPFNQLQPSQQRWVITAVVLLATLAIAHQGIMQPLHRRRTALEQQLAIAQERIVLLRALDTTSRELAENRQRLRSHGESAALLQEIADMAAGHDVLVNAAAPQAIKSAGRYTRLPIRVDVTGTFPAVLRFLHALETAPKPLFVEQVDVAPLGGAAWAEKTSRMLEAHVIVSALLLES